MTGTEYFVRLKCTLLKYYIRLSRYIFRTFQLLCPCVQQREDESEGSSVEIFSRCFAEL